MWRSRLVAGAVRRRWSQPSCLTGAAGHTFPRSSLWLGFRGIVVSDELRLDDDDDDDEKRRSSSLGHSPQHWHQQRRNLTTTGGGRRHGWKGPEADNKGEKKSFAKEFLEPAARGELKEKHSSGIPKLAAAKPKGHSIQGPSGDTIIDDGEPFVEIASESDGELSLSEGHDLDHDSETDEVLTDVEVEEDPEDGNLVASMTRDIKKSKEEQAEKNLQTPVSGGSSGAGGGNRDGGKAIVVAADDMRKEVVNIGYDKGRTPDYWREEDYDHQLITEEDKIMALELLGLDSSVDPLSIINFDEVDEDDIDWKAMIAEADNDDSHGSNDKVKDLDENSKENQRGGRGGRRRNNDDDDEPVPQKRMDVITPLKDDQGDLWAVLKNHPTEYAEVRYFAVHPESKREPKPCYPKNRNGPPAAVLDFFMRWMYVTGLPPALPEGGMKRGGGGTLTTIQKQEVQATVTRLFEVPSRQVFPANETSAFIGFESPENRELALNRIPAESFLFRDVTIAPYAPTEDETKNKFFKTSQPGTTVVLANIPPDQLINRDIFVRDLFPEGSDLGAAYPASSFRVKFLSPMSVLLDFDSVERAQSALASEKVSSRLQQLGRYKVRVFRARRNLVHERMEGPIREEEVRKLGERLIVEGDMPSKFFYQSHAGVIMLRNLNSASVSKETITEFFQPFSVSLRDEKGSVEFVQCHKGLPTDRAYVGFDRSGEAEAVMATFRGHAHIGDTRVTMQLLKDRGIPKVPKPAPRPERTEEELLKSLNDWEQYVDPEDIKYLEKHGVAKVVIDEQLRAIRFQNRSFGALDWAKRDEKLEPEKESGFDYEELVQMYISTLKECIATPENPGEFWEAMHFEGEPIDLSIFDMEKKRQKELLKKRGL
jgi:hypothetical protein